MLFARLKPRLEPLEMICTRRSFPKAVYIAFRLPSVEPLSEISSSMGAEEESAAVTASSSNGPPLKLTMMIETSGVRPSLLLLFNLSSLNRALRTDLT